LLLRYSRPEFPDYQIKLTQGEQSATYQIINTENGVPVRKIQYVKDDIMKGTESFGEEIELVAEENMDIKHSDTAVLKSGERVNEAVNEATKVVFDDYRINSYGFAWGNGEDFSEAGDYSIQLFRKGTEVYILSNDIIYANEDSSSMFSGCSNLIEIDFCNFNTSKVKAMERMFTDCHKLSELDLSNFDTSNVEDMGAMFAACWDLAARHRRILRLQSVYPDSW